MSADAFYAVLKELVDLYSSPKHHFKAGMTVHDHKGLVLPWGAMKVEINLTHTPTNLAVTRAFTTEEVLPLAEKTPEETGSKIIGFLDQHYKEMHAELTEAVEKQERYLREKEEQEGLRHEKSENPDLIQHVVAFRAWGGWSGRVLHSTGVKGVWEPGVNHARCVRPPSAYYPDPFERPPRKHAAPHHDCYCGLYGVFDIATASSMGHIIGAVKYWGQIEVHSYGLRAEYAEIVALGVGADRDMAEHFGVPLVHNEMLLDEAKKHGIEMPKALMPSPDQAPQNPFSGGLSAVTVTSGSITPTGTVTYPINAPVPISTKKVRSWPYRLMIWAVTGAGAAGLLMGVTNGILR